MDKKVLLGIISGLLILFILLTFIIYSNSDFDVQLINQVNDGKQVNTLLQQIDDETLKMEHNANERYITLIDKKNWGNGGHQPEDYQYYTKNYENDLKMIRELDDLRKRFVKGEISEDQFLASIKRYKEYIGLFNYI